MKAELLGVIFVTDCDERCGPLSARYDVREQATVFQHGQDEEHRLLIDDTVLVVGRDMRQYCRDRVETWLKSIHEYERDPEAFIAKALAGCD